MKKTLSKIFSDQRGVTGITAGVSLVVMIGMAAMTVDLGRAYVARNELQNVADAAALVAARELAWAYDKIAKANNQNSSINVTIPATGKTDIEGVATAIAAKHSVGGNSGITIAAGETRIGKWDPTTHTLTPTLVSPDAVAVTVRRDGSQNTPLATFFAPVLGINNMSVTATATAALGPAKKMGPGDADAPFGIDEQWFINGGKCGTGALGDQSTIKFSPTGTISGCAGWHNFDETQLGSNPTSPQHCTGSNSQKPKPNSSGNPNAGANASLLRSVIDCLTDENYTAPPVTLDTTKFDFNNGEITTAFRSLEDLYDDRKDNNGNWETNIPIYEDQNCQAPTGALKIVGFARAVITRVQSAKGNGSNEIDAFVQCDAIITNGQSGVPGTGGGAPLGGIPGLVS